METTQTLLQRCKTELGVESDYALAKALRVSHQAISKYQSGARQMDNWACSQVALVLGMDLSAVIAISELEREKDEDKRSFWENFYREHFGKLLVVVALMAGIWSSSSPETLQTHAQFAQKLSVFVAENGDFGVGGANLVCGGVFFALALTLLYIIYIMRILDEGLLKT